MVIREQRNTRKRGGDIRRQDIFNRILSIGYEMETTQLAKFTLIQGEGTLLHTDLAANDLAMVQKLPADNVRRQEILTLPLSQPGSALSQPGSALSRPGSALSRPGSALSQPGSALSRPGSALSDDAFSFLVTNDMAETNLTRYLQKVCEDPLEAAVAVENAACLAEAAEAAEADEVEEECDARVAAVAEDYKNALYTFRTEAGVVHPIQFVYRDPRPCGQFSDVEWVGTFLRPAPRKTLILDTFVTFVGALLRHLDTLTATPGTLMLNFSGTDQEAVLHPRTRMLFRAPDTNLHYMQIQYKEPGPAPGRDPAQAPYTINDVKIKPQMTFSCQAMYVIPILAEMVKPFSLKGPVPSDSPKSTMRDRLVKAVDDVVAAVHALTDNRDTWPAEGKRPTGKDLATFQGYLWLFIFKIVRYYGYVAKVNGDKGKEGAKYFKDALFFNSRHSNAQLYQAMKAFLAKHYAWSVGDPRTAETLQRLLLQPAVWEDLAAGKARKKAFDMSNDLPPTHPHYGDPRYALKSYLQFFDAPAPTSVLSPVEDAKMRDWLYYAKVDIYSSQMVIEDHRILVEVRFFAELVAEAFPEVLSRGTTSPTVAQLKECVAHYNAAKKTRGGGVVIQPYGSVQPYGPRRRTMKRRILR
jgi:hypothetical protein